MRKLAQLGPPSVTLSGEPVTDFVSEEARALLFFLASSDGNQKQ